MKTQKTEIEQRGDACHLTQMKISDRNQKNAYRCHDHARLLIAGTRIAFTLFAFTRIACTRIACALAVLCITGCEWEGRVSTRRPTIAAAEKLAIAIEDTWVPYDRINRRKDDSSPITVRLDPSSRRYQISWPGLERFTVEASAIPIKDAPEYVLADIELTDSKSQENAFRMVLIHVKDDQACLWWVSDKKLKKHAEALNLKIEFKCCFPFGTTVDCEPKDLLQAVLLNPQAVVGEPEVFYRLHGK
ncbi:MAG: hypothetical protein SFV81_28680 [Pirellulaceae bacterium]|nr:hypothetical protein [Pirellulaceae bacterium]